MPAAQVTRNGKTFDAGDVEIALLGYIDTDVVSISYNTSVDHNAVYTLSRAMNSYSMGKIKPTGKMTMLQTGVRKLEKIAAQQNGGDTSLWKLKPFVMTVSLLNDDQEPFTDKVTWKFMGQGRDISGTDGLQYEFDMFTTDVQFGEQ